MRIPSSIFGLVSQLIGCGGCGDCNGCSVRGKEQIKILPVPDPKISVCTEYNFVGPEERCKLAPRTDIEICRTIMVLENESICSDPKSSLEPAQSALNLKLLELGKALQTFREEDNARTIKFCADIKWERKGRLVATGGKEIRKEELPLIHREGEEICGEGSSLEVAGLRWESSVIEFVQGRSHYHYRNVTLQKTAEDAKKIPDWKEPPLRGGGKYF